MKKFSRLVLCLFMMIACFNICSVYAEGEETTDQPTQQESEENGSPSDDSDIDVQSDGSSEAVTDGVASITREDGIHYYGTIYEAIQDASEGETITLLTDTSEDITIEKNINLDLSGHTLTGLSGEVKPVIDITAEATIKNGIVTGGTDSGIKVRHTSATLDSLTLTNNSSVSSTEKDGGAITAVGYLTYIGTSTEYRNDVVITVNNCIITNNTAADGGGAIVSGYGMTLDINGSTINENSSKQGGAIYFWDNSNGGKIENTTFANNSADNLGGVIYLGGTSGNLDIKGSSFIGNSVKSTVGQGGAICNYGGTLTISESIFLNNSATYGGAIYSYFVPAGKLNIGSGSTFAGNNATVYGGAVYLGGLNCTGTTEISGAIFSQNGDYESNTASYAGAIFIYNTNATIKGGTFISGNSATNWGGGIYNYTSNLTIEDASITDNNANFGGGIINYNGSVTLKSSTVLYNNIAKNSGDDIYTYGTNNKFSLNTVGSNWTLNDDNHLIDGWYDDSLNNRWDGDEDGNHVVEADSNSKGIKAAHDIYRGYHVQYLDADTNEEIAEATSFSDIRVGTTVKVSAAEVEGYEFDHVIVGTEAETVKLDDDSETSNEVNTSKDVELVIDKDESKNVITFYYKALRKYTVNYVDKDSNESISDSKTVENIKVGTEVSEDAVSVDGYTLDGDSNAKLVVDKDDSKNVITFYYTKNADSTPASTTTPTDTPTSTPEATTPASTPVANNTTPATPVTPTRRTTPVTPITPVVTPTATPEATVEPTATPEATSTPSATPTVINDDSTPEAASSGHWALINLVCALLSVLLGVIVILSKHKKDEEDEDEQVVESEEDDEETSTRHRRWKVVAGIDAVIAVVVFIFTENITLPMQLVDKWTILMVVFLLVSVISTYFARKWHEDDEDDESSENA
jgi:hypothetical protein